MASDRRSSGSTSRKTGSISKGGCPPIAAIFLLRFDQRIGYSIVWSQSDGLELEGLEYKCFPSGSHNIQEDVIYFTQSTYTGLSIYRQSASTKADRNASFMAIGVLTPTTSNGIGDLWQHADPLRNLSEAVAGSPEDLTRLEHYWKMHKHQDGAQERYRRRSRSSGSNHGQDSGSFDPRQSLLSVLDDFGPLVFPIWRHTLLRERLLILRQPPLQHCCDIVQIFSMLSSIPRKVAKHLPKDSPTRTQPAFVIGIHDIPDLEKDAKQAADDELIRPSKDIEEGSSAAGWIACTSDKLLDEKVALSDMKIRLLGASESTANNPSWPEVVYADNSPIKATQRDLRRYIALRQSLMSLQAEGDAEDEDDIDEVDSDQATLLGRRPPRTFEVHVTHEHQIVEPQSWALVAYDGYMWWASAGERASMLQEEYDNDADLRTTADLSDDGSSYKRRKSIRERPGTPSSGPDDVYTIVLEYFHQITAQVMSILTAVDHTTGNNEPDQPVPVSKDNLVAMGLDPWSPSDRIWVAKMIKRYFSREATVEGASIECCGVKLY